MRDCSKCRRGTGSGGVGVTTVLIGSCGGLVGNYLARHLSSLGYVVVGMDCDERNATRQHLHRFSACPPASHPDFMQHLYAAYERMDAQCYIPGHSAEVALMASMPRPKGIAMHTHATALGDYKPALYERLKSLGIDHCAPVVPFCKKAGGSGSHGAHAVEPATGFMLVERLAGEEVTVDCLFRDGVMLGMHPRTRLKTMGGAAIVCETYQGKYCAAMEWALQTLGVVQCLNGPANAQFILTDSRCALTDLNLRLASGGLPLTVACGFDIPDLVVKIATGQELPKDIGPKKAMRMDRYFMETFSEVA